MFEYVYRITNTTDWDEYPIYMGNISGMTAVKHYAKYMNEMLEYGATVEDLAKFKPIYNYNDPSYSYKPYIIIGGLADGFIIEVNTNGKSMKKSIEIIEEVRKYFSTWVKI